MKIELLDSPDANGNVQVRSTIEASEGENGWVSFEGDGLYGRATYEHYQRLLAARKGAYSLINGIPSWVGPKPMPTAVLRYMQQDSKLRTREPNKTLREIASELL